jgi:Ser/Thr protein kinase RdoA (MazF antagonist)
MDDFYALSVEAQMTRLESLAREALTNWPGTYTDLKMAKYRENAVFSVYDALGSRYALRVHRYGYHRDDELRSELQWMAALGSAGIEVPQAVPTSAGSLMAKVTCAGVPESRQVDMLTWLGGTPLSDLDAASAEGTALNFRVGALAARIHNQSATWPLPRGFARHAWNDDGLIGPPLWGRFRDLQALEADELALIDRAVLRAKPELRAFGQKSQNYSLIHADFAPENLLYDGDRLSPIDFDDSGFGWHLFELATVLFAQMDEPDHVELREALVAGYRSERPLSEEDYARLPLFLLLRSLTYLGWVHTRHETETARELTPMVIDRACSAARAYLAGAGG